MRYAMAIDLKRCIGCQSCSVACKSANNLPNKMWWNRVLTVGGEAVDCAGGTYPNNKFEYLPINCQHCDNPPCTKACPVKATYKREEDGVVIQDLDKCIGCRSCMVACPYNVRSFNWNKPEYYVEHALGDFDAPVHQYGVVEKCTFCVNRLDRGEKPACMIYCLGRARYYGDIDAPESDISKAIKGRNHVKLLEEKGTKPYIFYLT